MLDAWLNTGMAAPYVMASTTWGAVQQCTSPIPTLLAATPSNAEVALTWSDEHSANPEVSGYRLYYDQAGKWQLVTELGQTSNFTDSGLSNSQEYCYKVSSYKTGCESAFSNILCAIPNNQGQARAGATLTSGLYQTTGRGKDKITVFVDTTTFNQGDTVTVRATVIDQATGLPISNATVSLNISGPVSTSLTTGPSDLNGIAEATWQTQTPNKRGQGGTATGTYSAGISDVSAAGYSWDGISSDISFSVQ